MDFLVNEVSSSIPSLVVTRVSRRIPPTFISNPLERRDITLLDHHLLILGKFILQPGPYLFNHVSVLFHTELLTKVLPHHHPLDIPRVRAIASFEPKDVSSDYLEQEASKGKEAFIQAVWTL
ncbi:hypothetical protein TNCV_3007191 [Trichonephila clavipes]|nr:hypothetical protein TNCV_3007191 [Trichonephila clavipes]